MDMITKDYKPAKPAKVLIIGHDPTLQKTDTQAEYAFFADYYFREEPKQKSENKKYQLAKKTFDQILDLTDGKYGADEIYITNLCNKTLPHVKGTVRIPKKEADEGVARVKKILSENPTIQYVFAMSLQVNYWLQELGLYNSHDGFLEDTRPKENDVKVQGFKANKGRTFLRICGKRFGINGFDNVLIIPVLHTKQYPLAGRMLAYEDCYRDIRNYFINQ